MSKPEIVISASDYGRLWSMLDNMPESEAAELLAAELERANQVDDSKLPPDVVAMHSTVRFTVLSTGKLCTYTLVFPREVDGSAEKLSILTPVGSALLGLSVGQEIEWPLPGGKTTRIRIDEILQTSAA